MATSTRVGHVVFTALLLLAAPSVRAAAFYVSTSGSDANAGTVDAPWRTIQKAADSAAPGSTVFIRGGTYKERVAVHVSGTPGSPITFRNFGFESVLIDGTGMTAPAGTSALFAIADRHDLVLDGLELANYQTATTGTVVIGVWVDNTASNVTLRHLLVHDIRHNGTAVNGTDAHAIAFYARSGTSPMTGIVVEDSEVRNCVLGSSEAVVVNGNVDGFRFSGNTVHDCNNIGLLAVGWEGTAPSNDQARNGTIADNLVYNITSFGNPAYGADRSADGIYCDGCRDVVIERNVVHHVDLGIEVGNEHGGRTTTNVTVRDNVLYLNNVTGLAFGGYDTTRGIVMNCQFLDNTLFHNDTTLSGTGEIEIQKAHDNTLRDNILAPSDQAVAISNFYNAANSYNNTIDYSDTWSPGGVASTFSWQNTEYVGLAAFRAGTGQETHGLALDPKFTGPAATPPVLRLGAGSPAIDAGDPAFVPASGETDVEGRTRVVGARVDIGAYETAPCPAAAPAGTPTVTVTALDLGAASVNWTAPANATAYDLVRGDAGTLLSTGGNFTPATQACLASLTPRQAREDRPVPAAGAAFWYLVRARNCVTNGTYDDGVPGQVGTRDAEIAASPAACP